MERYLSDWIMANVLGNPRTPANAEGPETASRARK